MAGPAGTGKSRACLEKLNLAAIKYPGMVGLICRQVRRTLPATAMTTYETWVAAELMAAGAVRYHGPTERKPACYRYWNGSELWLAGLDEPGKIMSMELDMVYVMESTQLKVPGWEALATRTKGRGNTMPPDRQQIIADANPDAPTHWLKQRCDEGTGRMLHSRHADNPKLYTDGGQLTATGTAYMAGLDQLTGVRRLRLRDGLWVAAEGIILESWDPAVHVIPRFPIPADWPRFWVFDFGLVHPFVWQAWARDPDGGLFLYREIYHTGRLVEDHARQIMGLVCPGAVWDDKTRRWRGGTWVEPKPTKLIADHDAEDRLTLKRYLGRTIHAANKQVKRGCEATEARLRARRLFLFEDALVERDTTLPDGAPWKTELEPPGYVWDETKEQPVKDADDGCDTMRYMVADQDLRVQLVTDDRSVWM